MPQTHTLLVPLAFAVALAFGGTSPADEKKAEEPNARQIVEQYVAAALAGKTEDAAALARPGQSPSNPERIAEFKTIVNVKALKFPSVLSSEKKSEAVAQSEAVKLPKPTPDGKDQGHVMVTLVRVDGKWRVKDIDFRSEDKAKERMKSFAEANPDAREVPAKPEK